MRAEGRGRQLLVVDDDHLFLAGLVRLLQSWGYHVTDTSDPCEAATLCTTLTFDLVITDLEMPLLDGAELTAAIRRALGDACPPVLVLTGLRDTVQVPGAAAVVSKDAELTALFEAIGEAMR